ncbi:MAG: hypothetical protein ABFD54_01305 [Armatimonadota bacterium]|nr:hypothetical protein [bacterium]
MSNSTNDGFEIRLRNAEGIPILHLVGTVSKTALKALKSTMDSLASAGHYNIVLNLERASVANWRFLTGLAGAVRNIRSHYGAVDLVVARGPLKQLSGLEPLVRLFRLSASENQAICRIKRLCRQPDGISEANARLLEKL